MVKLISLRFALYAVGVVIAVILGELLNGGMPFSGPSLTFLLSVAFSYFIFSGFFLAPFLIIHSELRNSLGRRLLLVLALYLVGFGLFFMGFGESLTLRDLIFVGLGLLVIVMVEALTHLFDRDDTGSQTSK